MSKLDLNIDDEGKLMLGDTDHIKALRRMGQGITKMVTDFNFHDYVEEYVKKGGYNTKMSLKENFNLLCKVIAFHLDKNKL